MTLPHTSDSGSATLLPAELLTLAKSQDEREVDRYRLMALRFLPFSIAVSRLMNLLALEGEQRLDELARAAERLQLGTLPSGIPNSDNSTPDHHFFIVSDSMASQTLAQAWLGEHQSLRFYRQLLEANGTPELDSLITTFVAQKLAQEQLLQESQEQLLAAAPSGYRRSA